MQSLTESSAISHTAASRSTGRRIARPVRKTLALVRDPLRMLLFFLTIVTISRVHLHYPVLAKFRVVLLLTLGALAYAYLNPRFLTRANVLTWWPMRLVTIVGVLACISAVFGISLGNSALFILDSFSKTLLYAFLLALAIRQARDLYTFVWAFVISCGILCLFSIFVFDLSSAGSQSARLGELYTYDANDLGVILMIGLPMTMLLVALDRGLKRLLLVLTLIGIAIAMARSGSRGGFLGLVAVALAALCLVNAVPLPRRIALLGAVLFALVVGAPTGYWKQMATILSPKEDYNYSSVDGRHALITRGLGYMARYPLFGIGVWNFAKAECTISPKIESRPANEPVRCVAPHNSFVQAGAELGVPGLIVWGSLVFSVIAGPIRWRKRLPKSWRKGNLEGRFLYGATIFFPIAGIGFAVTSFFVTFAFADPIYLLAALVTGLYIAIEAQLEAEGLPGVGPGRRSHSGGRRSGWRVMRSTLRARRVNTDLLGVR